VQRKNEKGATQALMLCTQRLCQDVVVRFVIYR